MIVRDHVDGDVHSKVWFDRDRKYRYYLQRRWQDDGPLMIWLMLNPSTADEEKNDPTLVRCQAFARRDGFSGFGVINLFAFRTPYPEKMSWEADPVGPDNDTTIEEMGRRVAYGAEGSVMIAGWGTHKAARYRGPEVTQRLTNMGVDLGCFGMTKAGLPRHPLYLPAASERIPYRTCSQ